MTIPLYQVDAFARRPFTGNPAAVCPLTEWLPAETMQQIAAENNLAETAFFIPLAGEEADFHLRWFTPTFEIDLCGHATLASAHVLWNERGFAKPEITFHSKSGLLKVRREADGRLVLDFPSRPPRPLAPAEHPAALRRSLGPGAATPRAVLASAAWANSTTKSREASTASGVAAPGPSERSSAAGYSAGASGRGGRLGKSSTRRPSASRRTFSRPLLL